jgi:rfaE bifunctional protein kinase chain/domain
MSLETSFRAQRVLLVGDLILDRYWWGTASRLSPEAPVPVLLKQRATFRPGGAANAAANVAALGARAELIGMIGADEAGEELRRVLRVEGIGEEGLVVVPGRPTTTKTRLIAGHQQLVRVDEEECGPVTGVVAEQVLQAVGARLAGASALLVSDYAKGLLSREMVQALLGRAREAGVPSFVDPKAMDWERYRGATYLKPNRGELGLLCGRAVRDHAETLEAGRWLRDQLRDQLGGTNLLVTEAADGMTLFAASGEEWHCVHPPREVYDITGAGDTVLAAFALSIGAGMSGVEAMRVASVAAGITIGVMGAATVSAAALERELLSGLI